MARRAGQQVPFIRVAPQSLSPVLLTCEHARRSLPDGSRATGRVGAVLRDHWGYDIGAWELTRALAGRLRAGAIGGRWSRLWIDLNRRAEEPDLVRQTAGDVALPWNAALSVDELERRLLEVHHPYHVEVERQIVRRLVRGVRPLIVAVHSFTPVLNGELRAFDLGILFDRNASIARRLGRTVGRRLRVRYNRPYSGREGLMYSAERHGAHFDVPCLELELNQSLFDRTGAASRLASILAPALARIVPKQRR